MFSEIADLLSFAIGICLFCALLVVNLSALVAC